ncbi:MAG: hypothetical protein IPM64_08925 [Phycisphaerales bacterium]|nr:hypothetical protein [Phycisphaerales bacterium]
MVANSLDLPMGGRRTQARTGGMSIRRRAAGMIVGAMLLALSGCASTPNTDLNRELVRLRERSAQQERELAARSATIDELHRRLSVATGVDARQLQYFYYPETIQVAPLSGGYDDDGKPGDEGVVVYLRPLDRDGDVVKVAGSIRVQLFDLSLPPDQTSLGELTIPIEKCREHWYGKLMTQHYTIRVPWQRPPQAEEVTVRATFANLFPQRVVTTQAVVKVRPPAK